ncbi:MAG: ribbon-helix-helix domain-containing protein [Actinomycetota bacterium]|nr:ribbon-helix-helix domain-containing protein [Actinomycetota bacterium]
MLARRMKRTTVKLPDELHVRLRNEAARREITVSELAREAIAAYLGGRTRRLGAAKAGWGEERDVSERIEEILSREAAP